MDDLDGFPSTSLISSMVSNICDGTRNETIVSFVVSNAICFSPVSNNSLLLFAD